MQPIFLAIAVTTGVCLICMPFLIPALRRLKFGQHVRTDGPQKHLAKGGTPTMGGVVFFLALPLGVAVAARLDFQLTAALLATAGFGLIGFFDDFIKIALKRPLGLKAKEKMFGLLLVSVAYVWVIVEAGGRGTALSLPGFPYTLEMGWLYFPFAVLVMLSANAVNLTDGLDGLASGVTLFAALSYVILGYTWNYTSMAVFAASLLGCCLGFLFFNRYPAKVFMGDTGSFILGGALCSLAVFSKTELLLLVIGGVYVLEALSVIIQVLYFRWTHGKRFFKMSPLHHHFELSGWSEQKVVAAFWSAAAVFACLAVALVLY